MQKRNLSIFIIDITLKGGIERVTSNLTNEFAKKYNVEIVSFFRTNDTITYPLDDNISIRFLSKYKFNYYSYKFLLILIIISKIKTIIRLKQKTKIIGMYPIVNILCIFFAGFNKNNLIASEHSEYFSQSKTMVILRKYFYKRLTAIVTLTNDGVRNFQNDGIRAVLIPNAVTNFNSPLQWENKINFDSINCLFAGRLEPVKQPEHFISLIKHFNYQDKISFEIVGDGPLMSDIKLKLKFLDNKNVHVHGNVSNIEDYYQKAHFLVCTSKTESFNMVALEAMSFGCVVIAYSSQVGTSEIIDNEVSGFIVNDGDFDKIHNIITSLILDKGKFQIISKNAISRANEFGSDKIGLAWDKLIDQN
ncbi:MAG: hypothetical protein RLZZ323_1487 [Bacteroidota bacterium]|jgi:glycosyltransferase involved in cell wall biosynthesis